MGFVSFEIAGLPLLAWVVIIVMVWLFVYHNFFKKKKEDSADSPKAEKPETKGKGWFSVIEAKVSNLFRGVTFYMFLSYVVILIYSGLYPWVNLKSWAIISLTFLIGTTVWKIHRNIVVPLAITIIFGWVMYHYVTEAERPATSGQVQAAEVQQAEKIKPVNLKADIFLEGTKDFRVRVKKVKVDPEYTDLKVKWDRPTKINQYAGVHWKTCIKDDQGTYYSIQSIPSSEGISFKKAEKLYYGLSESATLRFPALPPGVRSFTLYLFGLENDWSPSVKVLTAEIKIKS